MKYHSLFIRELGNMLQNVSSAAVIIGALRVKAGFLINDMPHMNSKMPNFDDFLISAGKFL